MNVKDYALWTAVISPMNEDQTIDYDSYEKVLREQEQAGNGILILGSTGEALNLDEDESKKILDFALSLNLKAPLMCGVGGINLKSTLKWVQYLETLKLDAYLMVSPLYAKPGEHGQYEWFKTLMDASTKPVMLYNVPGRTGGELNINAVKRLNDHKNLWAIKEASGSVEKFKSYVEAAPKTMVYSGDDALLPDFSPLGASGLVSVASNAWPKETNLFVKKCLDGTLKEAALWSDCSNTLFLASNPVPVKALMASEKTIKTNTMRSPLDARDLQSVEPLLKASEQIRNWYKNLM
ncbi:4-hydroxy-tetrahydrodipicolinate synthase [Halobacteriovorax sp. GB3]|uniref:4-hydroxy-tetrahydrodipicolinate synthase n=1 Tax=Halobacteriovorax sp. GB3 TaxID=2719615 RepID=UPI002360F13C|nr:4-hydroxy-tetrahydrodipicolinate synthase [Halobacteriovorax sp. GB3]MDD0852868.1 4-hydroxy-tetrahydrodipicolinate synthase [Halobacteriovorax sp. GB3]